MQLGRHLRELWRLKAWVLASAMLAIVVATWSVAKISLVPPGLTSRSLEIGAASARALVDDPRSSALDLRVNTYDFKAATNRALLIGNLMASAPVRQYIARRAGLPVSALHVSSPLTSDFPQALTDTGEQRSASDILKYPDEHRLSIQVNPTVPIVNLYSQAPSRRSAEVLANAAIDGMRDYLRVTADAQDTPADKRVTLQQLGRARGGLINDGVGFQLALLSFLVALAASCAVVLLASRVRRGWEMEAAKEPPAPPDRTAIHAP